MEIKTEGMRALGRPVPEYSEVHLAQRAIGLALKPPGDMSVRDLQIATPWSTAVPGVLQFEATYTKANFYGELNTYKDTGVVNLKGLLDGTSMSPEQAKQAVTITDHRFLANLRNPAPTLPPDTFKRS